MSIQKRKSKCGMDITSRHVRCIFENYFVQAKEFMSAEELLEMIQQWETELRGVVFQKRIDAGGWGERDRAKEDNRD